MPMAQIGTLDFKGFIENRKEARPGGAESGGHAYAYVSDQSSREAFEKMKPVKLAVSAAVRFFRAIGKSELLGQGVKVGPNQFPRVHNIAAECASTLGIAVPTLYIVNNPTMNAATYGTNDDSFIMIHSALVDQFTDEELRSVIGHECGHIHNEHVVFLTAMYFLTIAASTILGPFIKPAELALASWSRRAEITCDRAGLLCCKNLDVSTRTFARLALGSMKLYSELNLEAFLDQYEEGKDGSGRYSELGKSHPYLPKRVLALREFAKSELYLKHIGQAAPGLPMKEVDEKVHEIIRIFS